MESTSSAIRAAKTFEAYARHFWPMHRPFVRRQLAVRCSNCVLSEHCAALDSSGVCALCHAAKTSTDSPHHDDERTQAALNAILSKHVGSGTGAYDALVLFSGGKDSVYMTKRIRDEFPGLRLLAVTQDNTFMSPVAMANVSSMIARLDVDHVLIRRSRAFMKRLFRYGITHLNGGGCYGTVDFSDGELLLDTARRLAAEKAIPLILCGYSRYQVKHGLGFDHFESPRAAELRDRTQVAGMPLATIFGPSELAHWWAPSRFPEEQVARLLFPPYAWNLPENHIRETVVRWGLVGRGSESPIVTNHELIPLLGVVDVHRFGYSSFEIELCRMIREGKAEKDDWLPLFELLEHTARTGLFVKGTVLESLDKLDLTPEDVGVRFGRGSVDPRLEEPA